MGKTAMTPVPTRRLRSKTTICPKHIAIAPAPTRRLRSKTTVCPQPLTPLVGLVAAEAGTDNGPKQVYLVTLPHPRQLKSQDGYSLIAPGSLTKDQVLCKFLDACSRPIYVDPRNILTCPQVPLDKSGVWREMHQKDASGQAHPHDHLPVLASRQFRFMAVKRALLRRHGLASSWSVSHTGYWSCLRYLVCPAQETSFLIRFLSSSWVCPWPTPFASDALQRAIDSCSLGSEAPESG